MRWFFFLCIPVAGVELLMVEGQLLTPEAACQDHTKEIKDKITSKAVTEKAQYKSATTPFTYSSQEHPLPIHNTTTARNLFFRKKKCQQHNFFPCLNKSANSAILHY